ncbi:type VII toxin-antitoxin system MntA family adenylyltransferase antitoxin [Candidatus Viridilinea mediisalina]|nr:nucleotidyltransferase domain-containing protein [Candidatus Viridilinea mediisalina]
MLPNDPLVALLARTCGALPFLHAALLFGSAARAALQAASDLDLALLFAEHAIPSPMDRIELQAALSQNAGREVDLIILNQASPILAFQAVKKGLLIACPDRRAYAGFVVQLISQYADFKHVRQPIEAAVLARRVYA